MAAAFRELLERVESSETDPIQEVLAYAKEKKYSSKALVRVYEKLFDAENIEFGNGSIDEIVQRMVQNWRARVAAQKTLKGEHDSNAINYSEKAHNPEMANFLRESGIKTLLQLLESDLNKLTRNFESEREEARDRESRYIKRIANLEKQLREQNEQLECISSKLATLSGRPEVEANITACDAFRNKTKTKIDSRSHADTASSNKKSTKKKKDKNVRDAIGGSEVASKKGSGDWAEFEDAENVVESPCEISNHTLAYSYPSTFESRSRSRSTHAEEVYETEKNTKLTGSRKGLSNLVPVPVTVPISFQPFDSDDEDGIWKLVSSRTPTRKKAVLYVGNLRDQTNEDKLIEFITKRAVMCTSESENSSVRIPKIYNCKVFQKESEAETSHCSARITIDHDSRELLCLSRFWPNGTYARPWKFRNSQPSDALAVSSSEITGDSAAKGPE